MLVNDCCVCVVLQLLLVALAALHGVLVVQLAGDDADVDRAIHVAAVLLEDLHGVVDLHFAEADVVKQNVGDGSAVDLGMEADQRDARILAGVDDLVAACAVDRGQGDCVNVLGDQVFALLELGADVLICVVLDQLDIGMLCSIGLAAGRGLAQQDLLVQIKNADGIGVFAGICVLVVCIGAA